MACLYADEQFPLSAVEYLRALNHDVLTVQEAGQAGLKIPDHEVLAFASSVERAVITLNRKDFKRLHRLFPDHAGIIICTDDPNREELAKRIDVAIASEECLNARLIRVVRPSK